MSTHVPGLQSFSQLFLHCFLLPKSATSSIRVNPYATGGKFGQYKLMQKTLKMIETLANGYSYESTQRELSNEYQHDRVKMIFNNLCILVLWTKVDSASILVFASYFLSSKFLPASSHSSAQKSSRTNIAVIINSPRHLHASRLPIITSGLWVISIE